MRKIIGVVFFIVLFAVSYAFAAEADKGDVNKSLTLRDCYALSLKQSETIAIDKERLVEAEGHFLQALGEILPHVSFASGDKWSQSTGFVSKFHERKFVFSQLLFSGFKEFAAISGSRLEHQERENERIRAEQLLFRDVSDAFYLLMQERGDLESLDIIKKALINRIKELNGREKLGRSRRSEVVNTEAQLYAVVADYQLIKQQEVVVRQLLEFLVGRPVSEIIDDEPFFKLVKTEDYYVARATSRPDVVAALKSSEIFKKQVIIARSDLFPHVSVGGNTYLDGRTITGTENNWDVTLNIDVPIFQGTETWGAVRAAGSQARQAELTLRHVKRLAVEEIREDYARFDFSVTRYEALKNALSAAEMNYILQDKDYKYNLVNNIDVLQAIQAWQEAKRNYISGFYEAKRNYWQLRVAAGELL
jgi:outer membrane protein